MMVVSSSRWKVHVSVCITQQSSPGLMYWVVFVLVFVSPCIDMGPPVHPTHPPPKGRKSSGPTRLPPRGVYVFECVCAGNGDMISLIQCFAGNIRLLVQTMNCLKWPTSCASLELIA